MYIYMKIKQQWTPCLFKMSLVFFFRQIIDMQICMYRYFCLYSVFMNVFYVVWISFLVNKLWTLTESLIYSAQMEASYNGWMDEVYTRLFWCCNFLMERSQPLRTVNFWLFYSLFCLYSAFVKHQCFKDWQSFVFA